MTCLGIAIVIFIPSMLLVACTAKDGIVSETQGITTTQTTTTTATIPTTTPTTTQTTTTVTTNTIESEDAFIPVVGAEFPEFSWNQDRWTILQFDYEAIHEVGANWHYPWSLTIKNETTAELELTAYIIYIGFHNWIGHITETPFTLTGGETKTINEEDILSEALVDQIVYIEYMIVEVYVLER
jgi:hypothetical protein